MQSKEKSWVLDKVSVCGLEFDLMIKMIRWLAISPPHLNLGKYQSTDGD